MSLPPSSLYAPAKPHFPEEKKKKKTSVQGTDA
jgi:hypothetical protein